MKKLSVVFIILGILFYSSVGESQNICFHQDVAGKIVVEIEECRNLKAQIQLYKQAVEELETQRNILKEIVALQKEQVEIADKTIKRQTELLNLQKEMYERELKEAKPSFIRQAVTALGYVGVGVLIGLLLL